MTKGFVHQIQVLTARDEHLFKNRCRQLVVMKLTRC